jgi:hypothetical protein
VDLRKGESTRTLCSTLLRKGFAEPSESPPMLVRSYRTVSPLPVTSFPAHRRFAFCCTDPSGHPDLALASILLYGVPTFLDRVMPCRGHPANSPSLRSVGEICSIQPRRSATHEVVDVGVLCRGLEADGQTSPFGVTCSDDEILGTQESKSGRYCIRNWEACISVLEFLAE